MKEIITQAAFQSCTGGSTGPWSKDSCVQKEDQTFTVSASVPSKDLKAMAFAVKVEAPKKQELLQTLKVSQSALKKLEAKHGELQGIMMALENNNSIKHKVKQLKEPCSNLPTFVADLRKMTVLLELKHARRSLHMLSSSMRMHPSTRVVSTAS